MGHRGLAGPTEDQVSGSDMTSEEIAQQVFHVLHPHCIAYPGELNPCDHQVCDCFQCDNIPEKVAAMRKALYDILRDEPYHGDTSANAYMRLKRKAASALGEAEP